jgi:hypothetical protein
MSQFAAYTSFAAGMSLLVCEIGAWISIFSLSHRSQYLNATNFPHRPDFWGPVQLGKYNTWKHLLMLLSRNMEQAQFTNVNYVRRPHQYWGSCLWFAYTFCTAILQGARKVKFLETGQLWMQIEFTFVSIREYPPFREAVNCWFCFW